MRRGAAVLLCLALAFTLSACRPRGPEPAPSGQAEDGSWIFDDTVLVGRVVPLTGTLASFGQGTPYVEQTAIDAVNGQGGVVLDGKRCRLELIYADSGSDVAGAGAAALEGGYHDRLAYGGYGLSGVRRMRARGDRLHFGRRTGVRLGTGGALPELLAYLF